MTTCMGSVMLHMKFEVSWFNSLAVRYILRSVIRFGLVGLVWTGLVSLDFTGTTCMGSVMLHTKFEFSRFNSLSVRYILRIVPRFGLDRFGFLGLPWDCHGLPYGLPSSKIRQGVEFLPLPLQKICFNSQCSEFDILSYSTRKMLSHRLWNHSKKLYLA
jgi:hypothetical protein